MRREIEEFDNNDDDAEEIIDDLIVQLKTVDLTYRQAYKDFWWRATPLIISQASMGFASFWGMKLIASLHSDYSAAETPVNALRVLALTMATIPFVATNISASKKIDNEKEQGNIINTIVASHVYAAVVSTSCMLALTGAKGALHTFKQPDEILDFAKEFFDSYKNTVIPSVFLSVYYQTLCAMKNTWPVGGAYFLGSSINVILEHGFIKGDLGMKADGVSGYGKAVTIGNSVAVGLLAIYLAQKLVRNRNYLTNFSCKEIAKEIGIHTGFGVALNFIVGIELAALFGGSMLIGANLDKSQRSQYNILSQYAFFSFVVQTTFRTVVTSMVGHTRGQRDNDLNIILSSDADELRELSKQVRSNLNKVMFTAISSSLAVSLLQLITFIAAAAPIANSFQADSDEDFVNSLRSALTIFCVGQVFDHIRNVYGSALFGNENLFIPTLVSLVFVLGVSFGGTALALNFGADLHTVLGINVASLVLGTSSMAAMWHKREVDKMCNVHQIQADLHEKKPLTSDKKDSTQAKATLLGGLGIYKTSSRTTSPIDKPNVGLEDVSDRPAYEF